MSDDGTLGGDRQSGPLLSLIWLLGTTELPATGRLSPILQFATEILNMAAVSSKDPIKLIYKVNVVVYVNVCRNASIIRP